MNLELKEFRDIVENRINHYGHDEIPRLEPPSAAGNKHQRIFTNLQFDC